MQEKTDQLTGKQSKVLMALLTGSTIGAAAKTGGVNPSTVHAWLKLDHFAVPYREGRRAVVSQATATLQAACDEAVSTLRAVARDETAHPSSRVSAAKCILDAAVKGIELEDMAKRIEALEEQAACK